MPRRKKQITPPPRVFHPPVPDDTHEVLCTFAVAARVVCDALEKLNDVERELSRSLRGLVPPESVTAAECARLWAYFKRAVKTPKAQLRDAAGRAFYADLDSLGQKLDLPPLTAWNRLPLSMGTAKDAPAASLEEATDSGTVVTLDDVRRKIRGVQEKKSGDDRHLAQEVARWLAAMREEELSPLLMAWVGDGTMGRAEGGMLIRCLSKGGKLGDEAEALVDLLTRIGKKLTSD